MKTIVEANLYKAADELIDAEFVVQQKRRERDRLIRLAAPGMTLQAIGDMVGLTRAAICQIVKVGAPSSTTTGTNDAPAA